MDKDMTQNQHYGQIVQLSAWKNTIYNQYQTLLDYARVRAICVSVCSRIIHHFPPFFSWYVYNRSLVLQDHQVSESESHQ